MKLIMSLLCIVVLQFAGCDRNFSSLNPDMRGQFNLDIVGSAGNGQMLGKVLGKVQATGDTVHFCKLTKFEIQVLYANIVLGPESTWTGAVDHQLLNLPNGQGIRVNLVTEKLSDKAPLTIEDPAGPYIVRIQIGLEKTVTVCGYIDSAGTLLHSTATGFVKGSGTPTDYEFDLSKSDWFDLNSYPLNPGMEKIKAENVKGIHMNLAAESGFPCAPFKFKSTSTVEIRWPLETVIQRGTPWRISSTYWASPYFEGETV
ncbi:MAG: hypothetical protein JNL74_14335, partial [Fibrobacteres bacterium]|nr:hypothetical protein [Fibrobacterota bacterium]